MKSSAQSARAFSAITSIFDRCRRPVFCRVCGRPSGAAKFCPYCDEPISDRLTDSSVRTVFAAAAMCGVIMLLADGVVAMTTDILPDSFTISAVLFHRISPVAEALAAIYGKAAAAIFIFASALMPFAAPPPQGPPGSASGILRVRITESTKIIASSVVFAASGYFLKTHIPVTFLSAAGIMLAASYPLRRIPKTAFAAAFIPFI